MTDLSLVVAVLNEEEAVPVFLSTTVPVLEALEVSFEIIFIDDGSTDRTVEAIQSAHRQDGRVKLIQLTRNFGKEAAMTAGLDFSSGAAVIPIDVDLQDPPDLIVEFVRLWRAGFDIVFGKRVTRREDTGTKRWTAHAFYQVFNSLATRRIDENAGDFRLMSREVVDATLKLRERNRFMKGLFAWVGYKSIAVPYERPARMVGVTKFNYWKLWNFAIDGITSFSTAPLKIWTYVGLGVACVAILFTVYITGRTLIFGRDVPGYASLMVVVLVLGAVQLISLGIMGEYIGRLYTEVKQRPIYLVRGATGFARDRAEASAGASAPRAVPPVPVLSADAPDQGGTDPDQGGAGA